MLIITSIADTYNIFNLIRYPLPLKLRESEIWDINILFSLIVKIEVIILVRYLITYH